MTSYENFRWVRGFPLDMFDYRRGVSSFAETPSRNSRVPSNCSVTSWAFRRRTPPASQKVLAEMYSVSWSAAQNSCSKSRLCVPCHDQLLFAPPTTNMAMDEQWQTAFSTGKWSHMTMDSHTETPTVIHIQVVYVWCMSCNVVTCQMSCNAISCNIVQFHMKSFDAMPRTVISCNVKYIMLINVVSCHVMSCQAMSCHVM